MRNYEYILTFWVIFGQFGQQYRKGRIFERYKTFFKIHQIQYYLTWLLEFLFETLYLFVIEALTGIAVSNIIHCGVWDGSLPAQNHLDYQSDEKRTSLRDRDRLGNDPQWVPGFLSCCSWMFPEQLRNKSELVGSEEIHQA